MKLQIGYTHNGKSGVVVTNASDLIKWEKLTSQKLPDLFTKDGIRLGINDTAVLVWSAATRTLVTNEPFETWQLGLEDVFVEDEEDPKDTNPEALVTSDVSTSQTESLTVTGQTSTLTTFTP